VPFTKKQHELGQVAYTAYVQQSDGKSLVSGADLPRYEDLSQPIKDAWAAVGVEVSNAVREGDHYVAHTEVARSSRPTTATPGHTLVPDSPTPQSVADPIDVSHQAERAPVEGAKFHRVEPDKAPGKVADKAPDKGKEK
jgi:hypothetical protein